MFFETFKNAHVVDKFCTSVIIRIFFPKKVGSDDHFMKYFSVKQTKFVQHLDEMFRETG